MNAGSYLALGVLTVIGTTLPLVASSGAAFAGALTAAAVVLSLSGPGTGTVRLVLSGNALAPGRTVTAPAPLGAGVVTAVIGTPYFLYPLIRTRR